MRVGRVKLLPVVAYEEQHFCSPIKIELENAAFAAFKVTSVFDVKQNRV